jgi:hypothetical protein
MMEGEELEAIARRVIDSNRFMSIGTADDEGVAWVSPVWYAPVEYREFFWVSSPDARHSPNVATRSQVSIVVFDSAAPVGAGRAVYVSAAAGEMEGADLERGVGVYSRASVPGGLSEWRLEGVRAPAPYRLYRATDHWALDPDGHPDHR